MAAGRLEELPFYRERLDPRGVPKPWSLEDLEDFAGRTGDPFGGRCLPGTVPPVALQVEATSEPPVWTGLDGRELGVFARGLAEIWRRWGVGAGETIAFFEYGSSPLVLLASASYVARLRRGAADRLGVSAVCNDGVAAMAPRMVSIVENVAPSAIVIRRDLLAPFSEALRTAGAALAPRVRWVAVTEAEGAPAKAEAARAAAEWNVTVHRMLRADAAFLLAGECEQCGFFHLDPRSYQAESLPGGGVAVTTRFARLCPAVRYDLGRGELVGSGCAAEPRAERVGWE